MADGRNRSVGLELEGTKAFLPPTTYCFCAGGLLCPGAIIRWPILGHEERSIIRKMWLFNGPNRTDVTGLRSDASGRAPEEEVLPKACEENLLYLAYGY